MRKLKYGGLLLVLICALGYSQEIFYGHNLIQIELPKDYSVGFKAKNLISYYSEYDGYTVSIGIRYMPFIDFSEYTALELGEPMYALRKKYGTVKADYIEKALASSDEPIMLTILQGNQYSHYQRFVLSTGQLSERVFGFSDANPQEGRIFSLPFFFDARLLLSDGVIEVYMHISYPNYEQLAETLRQYGMKVEDGSIVYENEEQVRKILDLIKEGKEEEFLVLRDLYKMCLEVTDSIRISQLK